MSRIGASLAGQGEILQQSVVASMEKHFLVNIAGRDKTIPEFKAVADNTITIIGTSIETTALQAFKEKLRRESFICDFS